MISSRSSRQVVVDAPPPEAGQVPVADLGADGHAAVGRPARRPAASSTASPAWNPQATFALVTRRSRASSSPSRHTPKPSPRSAFRSMGNLTVVPGRACASSGRSAAVDDADDRVAAGRRMVGQEDQRLPVRRHLDRAEHHALAGQLAGDRRGSGAVPASRAPTRLLFTDSVYGLPSNASRAVTLNQSCRGPNRSRTHDGLGRPRLVAAAPPSPVDRTDCRAGDERPSGSTKPARSGGGPSAGERVGRPAAQHRSPRSPRPRTPT